MWYWLRQYFFEAQHIKDTRMMSPFFLILLAQMIWFLYLCDSLLEKSEHLFIFFSLEEGEWRRLQDTNRSKATSYIWTCVSFPFLHHKKDLLLSFHHSSIYDLIYIRTYFLIKFHRVIFVIRYLLYSYIWRRSVKLSCAPCTHEMLSSA